MIPLGLNSTDQAKFHHSLVRSHEVDFKVHILDLNHGHREDISHLFQDGQVNVDADQVPDRDLSATFISESMMSFESGNLSTGTNFAQHMIQVFYGVRSELLPQWVWVPVFCGNIENFSRNDAEVTLTAKGKEDWYSQTISWQTKTYPKGTKKTDIIKSILNRHGEVRLELPSDSAKTTAPTVMGASEPVWGYVQKLARSWGNGRLIFDGRGRARLFEYSTRSVWTFRKGDDGSALGDPKITWSMNSDFCNAARVYGGTPPKGKRPIFAEYEAPRTHALSPIALARAGIPQRFVKIVQDQDVTKQKDADAMAKSMVTNGLIGACDVQVESLVIPHLEPWDVCTVRGDTYNERFRLKKFSIPLNEGGTMSIGYTARVSRWKKR